MPVVSHYACKEPPAETVICRFMDLTKFRDLFASEELYFRRADLFKDDDLWEALPSDQCARMVLGLTRYDLKDELKLNDDQAFNRQFSENLYLHCWQIFEGETLHMWGRYGKGVVVFSRFDLLKVELNRLLDDIFLGTVKYSKADATGYNRCTHICPNGQAGSPVWLPETPCYRQVKFGHCPDARSRCFYSYRSARTGEMRDARHAGSNDATSDAASSSAALPANTGGSTGLTPKSWVCT